MGSLMYENPFSKRIFRQYWWFQNQGGDSEIFPLAPGPLVWILQFSMESRFRLPVRGEMCRNAQHVRIPDSCLSCRRSHVLPLTDTAYLHSHTRHIFAAEITRSYFLFLPSVHVSASWWRIFMRQEVSLRSWSQGSAIWKSTNRWFVFDAIPKP